MTARIRKGAKPHLYITEHMEARRLTDAVMAGRLDVAPVTIWRWRKEQGRLNPAKIAALAYAIGLAGPEELYRPPGRESIDARLRDAPDAVYEIVLDLAEKLLRNVS